MYFHFQNVVAKQILLPYLPLLHIST